MRKIISVISVILVVLILTTTALASGFVSKTYKYDSAMIIVKSYDGAITALTMTDNGELLATSYANEYGEVFFTNTTLSLTEQDVALTMYAISDFIENVHY